ncbi:MAG: NnrS family protein, partial [Alphaproteobacteria bacterium]|nr:NnrS family protein [Alphaproteobacteria bacterium]
MTNCGTHAALTGPDPAANAGIVRRGWEGNSIPRDLRIGAALFSSGFRPFFLLGAAYGPVALALGYLWPQPHWHPHEMLFGFAAALVCGVLLTALPSWAGAREVSGARLAALAALWLAGRVAVISSPWLPPALVALIDCALVPLLGW